MMVCRLIKAFKLIGLILGVFFWSGSNAGAVLNNGDNAIDLLGQYTTFPTVSYTKSGSNDGPNLYGFSSPKATAIDAVNHRLFVSDSNGRVLVFNLAVDNTLVDKTPDNVLGVNDFTTAGGGTTQASLGAVGGLAYDSTNNRLFVADNTNNRILVFDVASITDGENAVNVLGQTDFTTGTSGRTQSKLSYPMGLHFDAASNRLFVVDSSNHRIMIFDVASITDGENAVNVLGQSNFTTGTYSTTQAGLYSPEGVAFDASNNRLFVADKTNHRVMVFDIASITDGENAVNVLGQTDFVTRTTATTQAKFNTPVDVSFDATNNRLFVTEASNNRAVVFDVASITDGENAVYVLGQSTFTTTTVGDPTQARLYEPRGGKFDPATNRFYVGDGQNNRILIFDVASITNGENATDLIGQYSTFPTVTYTKGGRNNGPNLSGYWYPRGTALDAINHRLFVADDGNRRVLVYNLAEDNTLSDKTPDYVLGQPNFVTNTSGRTQAKTNSATGLAFDAANNRLFVSDYFNHRIMVFDVASITNGENAINVLGQTDFTTGSMGTTQAKLWNPGGLAYDSTNNRLFVADNTNNRILVFDVASITDGENAVNVLGQTDFTTGTSGRTQAKLRNPQELVVDAARNRLYVADYANHRVMVFDIASITDGENAINVLGQTDFTTGSMGTTQAKLYYPAGVTIDGPTNRLFVADGSNNRIMVFDVTSTSNGENAVDVLGQSNFTTQTGGTTQAKMSMPRGIKFEPSVNRLYVSEYNNNRIIVFDATTLDERFFMQGYE